MPQSSLGWRASRRCVSPISMRRRGGAYVLADNKLALNAGWDEELLLRDRAAGQIAVDCDIEITGFSPTEIDLVLDEARESSPEASAEAEDQIPVPLDDPGSAVTRTGDVWWLGATA